MRQIFSCGVVTAALCVPAHAQTAAAADMSRDELVVASGRAQQESGIQAKSDAIGVVDVPAPDQVGRLTAVELRRLPAPEAHQGVASDGRSAIAIDNSAVARYDLKTGRRVSLWTGDPTRFRHLNSCSYHGRSLVCAASNYPETPMASRALWFDPLSLKLQRVRELGHGYGSLTWLDWHAGAWWACYANYDGKGGEPGRDHRATTLVRYTADFVEQARWRFPDAVLARFAPRSASGGAWGRDGLLYVSGHDRPELYAMRVPAAGDTLELVATIAMPTGGQAIGWQPGRGRLLWSIDRATTTLVQSRIPSVTTD